MDSNHLSPKTTGLQPVATLQLRRTPMAEDRGIEPRSPEGESQVSNPVHYRSANLPRVILHKMVRAAGLEPAGVFRRKLLRLLAKPFAYAR